MRRNSNGNVCDRNGVALCHKAVIDRLRAEIGLEDCLVVEQREAVTSGHWSETFEAVARFLVFSESSYREISFMTGVSVDSVRTYAKWLSIGGIPFKRRSSWTGYRTSNPTRFRPD